MWKKGGLQNFMTHLDNFWEAFFDCDLYDMGGSGYEFTWWNGQGGEGSVEERLGHFCANTEWSILFPDATHIDSDF